MHQHQQLLVTGQQAAGWLQPQGAAAQQQQHQHQHQQLQQLPLQLTSQQAAGPLQLPSAASQQMHQHQHHQLLLTSQQVECWQLVERGNAFKGSPHNGKYPVPTRVGLEMTASCDKELDVNGVLTAFRISLHVELLGIHTLLCVDCNLGKTKTGMYTLRQLCRQLPQPGQQAHEWHVVEFYRVLGTPLWKVQMQARA
jgi:hypothetical protein